MSQESSSAHRLSRVVLIAVLCGGTIMGITVGIRQTFGLFLAPISIDLGLGRETFALGMGLMNLFWGLAAPFAGAIADKHGAGRVAVIGGICYAAGLAAMTLSGAGEQLLLGGLLVGLGLSGAGFTVVLGAVGRAAPPEKRTMALGMASMGGSIGQFRALPYTHLLTEWLGWSASLLALAVTALLVVPLAYGIAGGRAETTERSDQTIADAFHEARRHGGFWLLTAGFFVCGFHLAFVAVHLPAYLSDKQMPEWLAAATLTLVGLCNILGTYACGYLGQRYSKKKVLSLLYLARALIFLLFLVMPLTEYSVLAFGALMGFLWLGTVPLTSGLVAQVFGPTYLSMLFGIVFFSHQLGGFLGAWLAGYAYDYLGSYDAMWWFSVLLGIFSALLHWPIDERPLPRLAPAE